MPLTPTTDREIVGLLEAISSKLDVLVDAGDPVSEGGPGELAPGDTAAWAAMLQRVLRRDGGRCGLCATVMDTSVPGQVLLDQVVPAHLPGFDVVKGQAAPGRRFRSAGASIGNLQAVHAYCEDRRGDWLHLRKWRHPRMPSVAVAQTAAGESLTLPVDHGEPWT